MQNCETKSGIAYEKLPQVSDYIYNMRKKPPLDSIGSYVNSHGCHNCLLLLQVTLVRLKYTIIRIRTMFKMMMVFSLIRDHMIITMTIIRDTYIMIIINNIRNHDDN